MLSTQQVIKQQYEFSQIIHHAFFQLLASNNYQDALDLKTKLNDLLPCDYNVDVDALYDQAAIDVVSPDYESTIARFACIRTVGSYAVLAYITNILESVQVTDAREE